MESDLDLLKKYFKISFTVATVGVILPILFIGGASLLFGMQFLEALFIGIVFAATSVSISVEVLRATGKLQTKAGTAILGAAVVDDILAVIVLSLFTTFSHEGGKSGLTNNFFLNLLFEALYFVFVWLVSKFIAPKFMQLAEKINVSYSVVIASLILSLGMAYIAELVGLSAVVGAFFGGLAIRQTKSGRRVNSSVSAIWLLSLYSNLLRQHRPVDDFCLHRPGLPLHRGHDSSGRSVQVLGRQIARSKIFRP